MGDVHAACGLGAAAHSNLLSPLRSRSSSCAWTFAADGFGTFWQHDEGDVMVD